MSVEARALGVPGAGAFYERHCDEKVKKCNCVAMEEWPPCSYPPKKKLRPVRMGFWKHLGAIRAGLELAVMAARGFSAVATKQDRVKHRGRALGVTRTVLDFRQVALVCALAATHNLSARVARQHHVFFDPPPATHNPRALLPVSSSDI